jgi:uncharacterized protein YqjF (DUF2071 family)
MTHEERLAPTRRPAGPAAGFQRWDQLLFLHWEVDPLALRPLVDARLELDLFEGRCFVGLVAFEMQQVRPFNALPPFPTAQDFGEINLRTYVHHRGREPGVWFFSLDAASSLVVAAARVGWSLPYHRATVEVEALPGGGRSWHSVRHWPPPGRGAGVRARCMPGESLPPQQPGSLEFFLSERYQFYVERHGELLRARIHHAPYPLQRADSVEVETSLLEAAGLPPSLGRTPDYFSAGVDVDVFAFEHVAG